VIVAPFGLAAEFGREGLMQDSHNTAERGIVPFTEILFALNAATHALRLAGSAAGYLIPDLVELEKGSATAGSIAFIKNLLFDAQSSLAEAEGELGRLLQGQAYADALRKPQA